MPELSVTGIVLGVHAVLRPLGRLVDRAPATKDESVALYTLRIEVRRENEPHLRARLQHAVGDPRITVHGPTSRSGDEDGAAVVAVGIEMLIAGNARTLLDGLVTGLSVEPGVRAISWHAEDTAAGGDDDNDDHPERTRTRRRILWRPG